LQHPPFGHAQQLVEALVLLVVRQSDGELELELLQAAGLGPVVQLFL
jgi:hypothetical protein